MGYGLIAANSRVFRGYNRASVTLMERVRSVGHRGHDRFFRDLFSLKVSDGFAFPKDKNPIRAFDDLFQLGRNH